MDFMTWLGAVTSSLGISLVGAYWLLKTLVTHRLTLALDERKAELAVDLERHKGALSHQLEREKAALQEELARDKAMVEGAVRREVETFLGAQAAQRQYEFEARKRLYFAVGPLRFQLLLACRDLAGRVGALGSHERFTFDFNRYYARSTLYRLLRPLAITELIQRQVAHSDFAVDAGAVDCLRFRKSLVRILSGDELVAGHPKVNWSQQVEHVFADALTIATNALIANAIEKEDRILRFDEFNHRIEEAPDSFEPFPRVLSGFTITSKPILWLRLVAYGNACNEYVHRAGRALGFEDEPFGVEALLRAGTDPTIVGATDEYVRRVRAIAFLSL